jgi:uncharacterized protein YvpB
MEWLKKIISTIKNFYFPQNKAEHHRIKVSISRIFLTLIVIIFSFVLAYFAPAPKALAINSGVVASVPINKELKINFSAPVERDEAVPSITPEVQGEWSWSDDLLGTGKMYKTLVFKPIEAYKLDTTYVVKVNDVKRVIGLGGSQNFQLTFRTLKKPLVVAIIPADQTNNVRADNKIVIKLDSPNKDIVEYAAKFDPDVAYTSVYDSSLTTLTLSPKDPLIQGQKYTMTVSRTPITLDLTTNRVMLRGDSEVAKISSFSVAMPPGIDSYTPSGNQVFVTTKEVAITFNQDMDRTSVEQNFVTEPSVPGSFTWLSNSQLVYQYSSVLNYATTYRFIVKSGTKNLNGGFLTQDAAASFTTIGSAYVTYFTPSYGSSGNKVGTSITVGFDQDVDHTSAQNNFSLSGVTGGGFSWSGNAMKYYPPGALAKDSSYTVTVAAGVKSINGLNSNRTFSSTFYTEETVVKLPIALDFQDRALTCEAASLKMALNYKGASVSEGDILARIPYDPTPRVGNIWGNPYTSFVGSVDGAQNTTGYGVYWGPIATAGSAWRPTQAFTGWGSSQLATELSEGNPIVVWGTVGNAHYDTWQTSDGQTIDAWKGEHARLLIGFVGPVSNPRQFIINDPVFGQLYWSAATLMNNMSAFGNSGVVVR